MHGRAAVTGSVAPPLSAPPSGGSARFSPAGNTIGGAPHVQRILNRLPPHILGSLSAEQLAAIEEALRGDAAPHLINFQASLPMLGGRHYLTIFFGRERRNRQRLSDEGKLRPLVQLAGYGLIVWVLLSLLAATGIALLYLIKCMLGIDLFKGPSVLHNLFFR